MMISKPTVRFRPYVIGFACILVVQAAWILFAEAIRHPLPYFPTDQNDISTLQEARNAATVAARIGWIRGDLWMDDALASDVDIFSAINTSDLNPGESIAENRRITERAAAQAPYDARAWLLLSMINAQSEWTDDKSLAQLKMSFYTSPNDIRLLPLRIRIATRFQSMADDELQTLIDHEIRTALRNPELRPFILTAYREASPAGRQFIEAKVTALDPQFSAQLRAGRR